MLATVLIAEADAFVALWKDVNLQDGRDRVAFHGHGLERAIQTGVGLVGVLCGYPGSRSRAIVISGWRLLDRCRKDKTLVP
jgi:hypothetical protein